ncbi:hypothetical protein SLEP1_g46392 [Rubroshorea leprosula]|uniref:Uncharacterized protein n=1 Tax=Rubroshorea leprosula TaxID=152421 RepID=A0AAV5LM73_9ROSI|nr:hypothetical protein SLEP1_g46392 [Rubroshorea leprosula]
MFFRIVLEHNMQLHSRHIGRDHRENLVSKLMKEVEGTCRKDRIGNNVVSCLIITVKRCGARLANTKIV